MVMGRVDDLMLSMSEAEQKIPVKKKVDVLVVGGGTAGDSGDLRGSAGR